MKNKLITLLLLPLLATGCAGGQKGYVLNESTFFLVMTNIQYYPEEYVNKDITYDCFTYNIKDVNNKEYLCGTKNISVVYVNAPLDLVVDVVKIPSLVSFLIMKVIFLNQRINMRTLMIKRGSI